MNGAMTFCTSLNKNNQLLRNRPSAVKWANESTLYLTRLYQKLSRIRRENIIFAKNGQHLNYNTTRKSARHHKNNKIHSYDDYSSPLKICISIFGLVLLQFRYSSPSAYLDCMNIILSA